jgi:hypothetical protein
MILVAPLGAEVVIELVPVGDAGNMGEPSRDRIVGDVRYTYSIGKFEITNGQYVEFLKSVAGNDRYGLCDGMGFEGDYAMGVHRMGEEGSYEYALVDETWRHRPVPRTNLWQGGQVEMSPQDLNIAARSITQVTMPSLGDGAFIVKLAHRNWTSRRSHSVASAKSASFSPGVSVLPSKAG